MKGKYTVHIYNNRLDYNFTIKNKITMIKGDSGTGKTQLIKLISNIRTYKVGKVVCDMPCKILGHNDWDLILSSTSNNIYFLDEDYPDIRSLSFAKAINASDNYFVIISRAKMKGLTYSSNEIYSFKAEGKYHKLVPHYDYMPQSTAQPTTIITEDSNSGYQFFLTRCNARKDRCISANGKSNIVPILKNLSMKMSTYY